MKKAFFAILIFYISFHFIIPEIYYLFFGNCPIYSDLFDSHSAYKAIGLNILAIGGAMMFIHFLPSNDFKIEPVIESNAASELYYFSIVFSIAYLFVSGGFEGVIHGEMLGSFMNYASIFLNPMILLMCAIFLQKGNKAPVILMILLYIIVNTAAGSRGAVVGMLLFYCIGLSSTSFDKYRASTERFLKCCILISPVLFYLATIIRYPDLEFDLASITNLIVGRVSAIELGMIPIYHIDDGGLDMNLFYEKYDFVNQIKLSADAMIPGQVFEFDVMPNNYFRAIFFGLTKESVMENYMSINITLPVYFYAYFGYLSVIVTIIFLVVYFGILRTLRNRQFAFLVLLYALYQALIYFDWVMVFTQMYSCALTILTLKGYMILRESLNTKSTLSNSAR